MGAKPSEEKDIDFATTKSSRVVPRVMFNDLIAKEDGKLVKDLMGRMQFANKENEKAFKLRLAAKYSIEPNSILTYDEMLATPVSKEKNKYNVIVMPGDGDQGANRNDVIGTYLLFH